MATSETLAPLRERAFRYYYFSRGVNLVGSTMSNIALAFAVLEVSSSPSALGVVLAAHSIPMVVFLLLGGVIADRFGRTLVIQVGNIAAGASQLGIGLLVVSGHATVPELAVLSAIGGISAAVTFPALAGIVPALVPKDQLQPANVLLGLMRSSMNIGGPVVASVLVVGLGAGWAIVVDGVSYFLAAALLLGARIPPRERADGDEPEGMVAELREGWRYFCATTWLWVVVLGFGVLNGLEVGAFNTLGPVLAKESAIGVHGWGLIASAQAVGLLVMGLVLARVSLQRPLLWGMIGMFAYGLPILVLGLSAHTAPVMVAAFLGGLGVEVFGLGWNLAMQENVPEDMLARAYSYDSLGSFVGIPVGQLTFGPLAVVFGLQNVILVAGIVYVVVVALVLLSRSVRDLPRAPVTPDVVAAAG